MQEEVYLGQHWERLFIAEHRTAYWVLAFLWNGGKGSRLLSSATSKERYHSVLFAFTRLCPLNRSWASFAAQRQDGVLGSILVGVCLSHPGIRRLGFSFGNACLDVVPLSQADYLNLSPCADYI